MSEHLHHKLSVLHESLLHGKLPRNLRWTDALELIGHLGEVQAGGGDEFAFVVGANRELFQRPHTSELAIDEVSRLRRFLKAASAEPASGSAAAVASTEAVPPCRMVVVIDHHGARIYRDRGGSRPQDEVRIEPYDPHDFHHHLVHRKEAHYEGGRVPEENSFYAEVLAALVPAKEIVLIGHATGKSSAVEALVTYMKKHRSDIFGRVKATETVDLSALTEPEIESIAKRHMH